MASPKVQTIGNVALGLSLLIFAMFFLNVVIGGPLGRKPWLSDLGEMLTLFAAVTSFVVGTIAREAQASAGNDEKRTSEKD